MMKVYILISFSFIYKTSLDRKPLHRETCKYMYKEYEGHMQNKCDKL